MDTDTIQTTVRLPEKLHQQAKIYAIMEKISLNDLLVAALQAAALPLCHLSVRERKFSRKIYLRKGTM